MNFLYITIIAILAAAAVLFFVAWRSAKKHKENVAAEFRGICDIAVDRTVRKRENLEKVRVLFMEQAELSNADIRARAGLSRRAVVRYLDDLEKEGFIEQAGDSGRAVVYRRK